jgi:Na+(H+)/acetate symporter ActP
LAACLFLASFCHYRQRIVRWVTALTAIACLVVTAVGRLAGFGLSLDQAARVACLAAAAGVLVVQYLALQAGDRPERTA